MRIVPLAVAAALLATVTASAATHDPVSWGKAGVSFEQYRSDAVTCGRQGYYLDVSGTDAAKVFRAASRQIDTITEAGTPSVDNGAPQVIDANAGTSAAPKLDEGQIRSVEVGTRISQLVNGTHPEARMREVGQLLQSTVEQCLTALGYHRFRLTHDQQRQLAKLRHGTQGRQNYLYALASDPQVLVTQAID